MRSPRWLLECRKKRNSRKGRQAHWDFGAVISNGGMVVRTLEEPWECMKANGLERYLGGSIDKTWWLIAVRMRRSLWQIWKDCQKILRTLFRMMTKNFIVAQILWEYSVNHSYAFIHTHESGYFRRLLCLWASHSYGVIDLERKTTTLSLLRDSPHVQWLPRGNGLAKRKWK